MNAEAAPATPPPDHLDALVVGGGLAGLATALTLKGARPTLEVAVFEARARPAGDARSIALSYGGRALLERLGAWDGSSATPVRAIHVSQRGGFGRVWLDARDVGWPALGYVLPHADLAHALERASRAAGVRLYAGVAVRRVRALGAYAAIEAADGDGPRPLTARLIVHADGGASDAELDPRGRDYHQTALISQVRTKRPHDCVAFERFTPTGPVALLPHGEGMALVWTLPGNEAADRAALPQAEFLAALQDWFGHRLGRFLSATPPRLYPLRLRYAPAVTATRRVWTGNAAQSLHPVAAQGFNLALRDAWALGEAAAGAHPDDFGAEAMLSAYRARRRRDRAQGILVTDGLARLFTSDQPWLSAARGLGLTALDLTPPAKRAFIRRMGFGA